MKYWQFSYDQFITGAAVKRKQHPRSWTIVLGTCHFRYAWPRRKHWCFNLWVTRSSSRFHRDHPALTTACYDRAVIFNCNLQLSGCKSHLCWRRWRFLYLKVIQKLEGEAYGYSLVPVQREFFFEHGIENLLPEGWKLCDLEPEFCLVKWAPCLEFFLPTP